LKEPIMRDAEKIDRALDEVLVNLGSMVLRLADPEVTRTAEERQALVQSVRQYARCADRSADPRVRQLRNELEETIKPGIKPNLRIVSSR
jgi:ribosome recycling factor